MIRKILLLGIKRNQKTIIYKVISETIQYLKLRYQSILKSSIEKT
jgi:hypothetical protein